MNETRYRITTRRGPRTGLSLRAPSTHEIHPQGLEDPALTCPRISFSQRNGELPLGGPLGDGLVLHRHRVTRFELRDDTGATLANLRQRVARPSRNWHPSWEVTLPDGATVTVTEDATFSSVKAERARAHGDPLVWHRAPGLESTGYADHADLTLHDTCPLPRPVALVASLIAYATHRPADPS